jgi:hypothetical protein
MQKTGSLPFLTLVTRFCTFPHCPWKQFTVANSFSDNASLNPIALIEKEKRNKFTRGRKKSQNYAVIT